MKGSISPIKRMYFSIPNLLEQDNKEDKKLPKISSTSNKKHMDLNHSWNKDATRWNNILGMEQEATL